MSKAISYYDWSLGFKKNLSKTSEDEFISNQTNSIGLPEVDFKNFLDSWKEKNL